MGETEIINRLKAQDETAYKELVSNYMGMVINTCFGLLHNIEDAEDVAQDVFIEVFRSVHKFRADSKLSTWLYRIAINRSLNHIRDNKRRSRFLSFGRLSNKESEHTAYNFHGDRDLPDAKIEAEERRRILHKAIDSLPKNQRIAFTLNRYEELSYKEIAGVMDLSLSAVESLLHRAKKGLQKKLYNSYKKGYI